MRCVAVTTVEQQAVLMRPKSRDRLIRPRTMLINALRGHLGEDGVVAAKGPGGVSSLMAMHSTAGDFVSGGGIFSYGTVTLTNSTVSGNSATGNYTYGGGIYGGRSLTLANSIVAGNGATSGNPDIGGTTISTSNGHNIFGSNVAGNAPGDRENVSTALLFAGGLADNGGPTRTIALRDAADNPALGGADPDDAPTTDQRGFSRPSPAGTDPDIGAFELAQSTGAGEIVGTNGPDVLRGSAGPDVIRGLGGGDQLYGLLGDDRLFGGAGFDRLFGGHGLDQMRGDGGADRFVFRKPGEAAPDGPGYDEILDSGYPLRPPSFG